VEYLDKLAEESVKQAIQDLRARGERPCSKNVPPEARKILVAKGRHRVSQADAEKRVQQAVARLKERKEIKAPAAPFNDWAVMGAAPASTTESSQESS
jgi:hypothetical protein